MNIDGVPEILAAILSEDDDEAKEVYHPDADYPGDWTQVGGDYGNPWVYGGDWFNIHKKSLLHFAGIEQDREVDYRKIPVPEHAMAKLKARIHDPYLDTDEAKEDPAWLKRMLDSEEREIDRIVDNYRVAKAALIEDHKGRQFYLLDVPETLPSYLQSREEAVMSFVGMTPEQWAELPVEQKLIEFGSYMGFHEIGSELTMNKVEAQKLLGFSL